MTGRTSIVLSTGLLALVVTLIVTLDAQVRDRPEVLLQAAIKQELVDGDLAGAIEQFKQLAGSSNPAVAAEALVRLAASYDKLGHPETRSTYERVVREFPGQQRAAAEARAWLEGHASSENARSGIRLEQVWTGPDVNLQGQLSPDGRYLTFADWTAGPANLAMRDLRTGANRLLTSGAALNGWVEESLLSPDGKEIAYRWGVSGENEPSIRVIGVDGSRPRVLLRDNWDHYPEAWSPDGKYLAATHVRRPDLTFRIVLISVADGSVTQLKSTAWRFPTLGGFSPDGRFLVYSLEKDTQLGDGGVFALAVDGSRETALVQGAANDRAPVWSPEGDRVFFLSDRSGGPALWSLPVSDGRPGGSPTLMRANLGDIVPMGFTRDGSFHYGTQNLQTDAYLADIDLDRLTVGKPALALNRFVGSNFGLELSPDGKHMAFFRRPYETGAGGPAALIVRSVLTGDERTLANLDVVYSGDRNLQWYPDSRSVLLQSTTPTRKRFRRIDIATGETHSLFEGPYSIWRTTALAPDGQTLFYSVFERSTDADQGLVGTVRLIRRHLVTGEESELYRVQSEGIGFFALAVSPDGSRLAFKVNVADGQRALLIMPADGGTPREIHRAAYNQLHTQGAMIWSRDGRRLLVRAQCGGHVQLCAISVDGGDLTPLGLSITEFQTPMLSADGGRIAFTGTTRKRELWVIRNLLQDPVQAP